MLRQNKKDLSISLSQIQLEKNNIDKEYNSIKIKLEIANLKIQDLQNNEITNLKQISELKVKCQLLYQKLVKQTLQQQQSILSQKKYNKINSELNLITNEKELQEQQFQQEKINEVEILIDQKEILIEQQNEKIEIQKETHQYQKCIQKKNNFVFQGDQYKQEYDMIIQLTPLQDLYSKQPEKEEILITKDDLPQKKKEICSLRVQNQRKDFDSTQENVIVIGFHGQKNKGKTFILNSLIHEDFPIDFLLNTTGVCIKEHNFNFKKLLYVDSEGIGNPISIDYDNNPHYQTLIENKRKYQKVDEDINDKYYNIKATEQIQQEFIIQNSNILIIAISQVTLEDQKQIHSISEKFMVDSDKQSEKKLIVVHNLKDFQRQEDVRDYMQQLKLNFSVKEQEIDTYDEQQNEEHSNTILFDEFRPHIIHVVMAYKESEAGKQYNKFALYYIKQIIGLCKDLQKFDIRDKLKMYLNQNLHNFIEIKSSISDEIQQAIQSKEMLDYCQKNEKIYLKQGFRFERLKELQIDIFGSLFSDCNYSIVKSRHNPEKELFLLVEIPGTATFVRRYDKPNGKFIIKISQNDDLEKKVGDELKLTTRKFEQREMTIQICKEKELWIYSKDSDADLKNGVHMFVFTKEDDNTDFS